MITVVDYGLGNIQAFVDIYRRLNVPVRVARSAAELKGATRLILPGVGAFDWAMERLNASGMRELLVRLVVEEHCHVLGVCVGMQMLAHGSAEGAQAGLGWIPGRVERFTDAALGVRLPVPHMGWNDVAASDAGGLFSGIRDPRFYFLHSYYFIAADARHVIGTTSYGQSFASAVGAGNVYGTQFHPEKSHHWGVQLLKNFAEIEGSCSGRA